MVARTHHRLDRISDAVKRELALVLQFKAKDPRLGLLTISAVKVSRDLAFAKVYFTTMGEPDEIKQVIKLLQHMAGFLRSSLARNLDLRVVPKLTFHYDDSIAYGNRMSRLIDDAIAVDAQNPTYHNDDTA